MPPESTSTRQRSPSQRSSPFGRRIRNASCCPVAASRSGSTIAISSRHVVGDGAGEQGLHLPVELLGRQTEQFQHVRVGLHAAGSQFQDEGAALVGHERLSQMRLRGLASGEASGDRFESGRHLVGVELQEAAVVGAEAVQGLPGDDQASELLVAVSQGQRAQRDPGRMIRGHRPGPGWGSGGGRPR